MRSINLIIIGLLLWAVACEDETFEFDHPLDSHTGEVPALIFNPDSINILYGESAVVGIYVLQAEGVSGVHAQVQYDTTILSVSSVKVGNFFSADQAPIFIYKDKDGLLDIFSYSLGSDGSVTGTGIVGIVTFNTRQPGNSQIKFTTESELVDPSDQPIEIRTLGQGKINVE